MKEKKVKMLISISPQTRRNLKHLNLLSWISVSEIIRNKIDPYLVYELEKYWVFNK